MNKKTSLLIVGALVLSQVAQAATRLDAAPLPSTAAVKAASDQSPGEWAKQAIALVVSRGLVVGYPGGTFDWQNPATRAEVAQIFARLFERYPLDQLGKFLTQSDLTLLENGLRETRDGLVALKTQSTEQAQKSGVLINGLQGQLSTLDAKLALLTGQVDEHYGDLDSRLSAVSESLDVLSGNLDELRQSTLLLEGIPEKQETLEARLTQLEQKQGVTNTTFGKDIAELGTTAVSIQNDVVAINEVLDGQVEQFVEVRKITTKLEDTLSDLDITQTGVSSRVEALEEGLSEVNSSLESLATLPDQVSGVQARLEEQSTSLDNTINQLDTLSTSLDDSSQSFQAALDELSQQYTEQQAQIQAAEKNGADVTGQLAALERAMSARLDALEQGYKAAVVQLSAQLTQVQSGLSELTASLATFKAEVSALNSEFLDKLNLVGEQVRDLESKLETSLADFEQSQQESNARLDALANTLGVQLTALEARVTALEGRQTEGESVNARQTSLIQSLQARLDARDARETEEAALARARRGLYLGLGGYGVGIPSSGLVVRLQGGDDALLGGFGLRLTGDLSVDGQSYGNTVAALATYRASLGALDGYVGAGVGQNISRGETFGDLTLGAAYRVLDFVGLFAEARQNFYFNSDKTVSSLAFGVQIRF